jgi:hypothetical protein
MLGIHPAAEANINTKATAIVTLLKEAPRMASGQGSSNSEIPVAATITEKDIIGEIGEASSDWSGRTTESFFMHQGKRIGLTAADYELLIALSESVQRLPAIRDRLSQRFIEESLFAWIKEQYISNVDSGSFVQCLKRLIDVKVKKMTIYVPIASMIVEAPFEFCGVTIQNMSKAEIDEWSAPKENALQESVDDASKMFDDLRKKFQGRAAAKLRLECEPDHANDVAVATTKRVTELLGIYSGAVLSPGFKSTSKVKGTETVEQSTSIMRMDSGELQVSMRVMDIASARNWAISKADLRDFRDCGLDVISTIYLKKDPSEFESTVLSMAYLYAKAAFTSEPMAKLVYMLSALESTLLKNEGEPIQQNLAERMAIVSAERLDERKEIVRNVRAVYALRSRYLHHGHSTSELEHIKAFFLNVWVFFVTLVNNTHHFKTKQAFLEAIDDRKLS